MTNEEVLEKHECQCWNCVHHPTGQVAQAHKTINRLVTLFDEKQRRRFVGFLAAQIGRGGIQQMASITGLHRQTIARGQGENQNEATDDSRVRQSGGGRKPVEKKRQTYCST